MNAAMLDNRPRTIASKPSLTVGQDAGDLKGCDDKVIQAGVDYLGRFGGGVLTLLPGIYTMANAVYMQPHVTLRGFGTDTVLLKSPSFTCDLVYDCDWYEARVRVRDASGFSPGCGIMLQSFKDGRLTNVVQATVIAVDGDEVALDRRLLKNFWVGDRATASTLYPLITAAAGTCDACVENLVLDGNRVQNDEINGNYAGAVFLQECDRFEFRQVTAQNYHGDGFSFQVCDDIHFEACKALNNESRGFHPGSGSQRPVFDRCEAIGNTQGIFFCWGVSDGQVTHSVCSENLSFGISIGHRDTDNRIFETRIERNGKVGILFREPVTDFRGGHRNEISRCTIVDNGTDGTGQGIDIQGLTCDLTIQENEIRDSGSGFQSVGIRVSRQATGLTIKDNVFGGAKIDVEDPRGVSAIS